jgi:thiosulfate dehydrogenase
MYIYATEKSVRSFDIANGTGLYSGSVHPSVNCSSCHGADGRGLVDKGTNTADIFFVAKDDPWEFFHKVRVGQPGTAMPALLDPSITLTDKDGLDVLGYAQDAFAKRP